MPKVTKAKILIYCNYKAKVISSKQKVFSSQTAVLLSQIISLESNKNLTEKHQPNRKDGRSDKRHFHLLNHIYEFS
jgi:hypothetical protein